MMRMRAWISYTRLVPELSRCGALSEDLQVQRRSRFRYGLLLEMRRRGNGQSAANSDEEILRAGTKRKAATNAVDSRSINKNADLFRSAIRLATRLSPAVLPRGMPLALEIQPYFVPKSRKSGVNFTLSERIPLRRILLARSCSYAYI